MLEIEFRSLECLNETLRAFLISSFKTLDNFYFCLKMHKDVDELNELIEKVENLVANDKEHIRFRFLLLTYRNCTYNISVKNKFFFKYQLRNFLYMWQTEEITDSYTFLRILSRNMTVFEKRVMSAVALYILIFSSKEDSVEFLRKQTFDMNFLKDILDSVENCDYISLRRMMGDLWYYPASWADCKEINLLKRIENWEIQEANVAAEISENTLVNENSSDVSACGDSSISVSILETTVPNLNICTNNKFRKRLDYSIIPDSPLPSKATPCPDKKDKIISSNINDRTIDFSCENLDSPLRKNNSCILNQAVILESPNTMSDLDDSPYVFKTPQKPVRSAVSKSNVNDTSYICSPIVRQRFKAMSNSRNSDLDQTIFGDFHVDGHSYENESDAISFLNSSMLTEVSSLCFQKYKCLKVLGEGGYSKVFEAINIKDADDKKYAIKVLYIHDDKHKTMIEREIMILQKMSDTNYSIKLFESYIGNEGAIIVMEKAKTDLKNFIASKRPKIDSCFILYFWLQMLHCVKAMHDQRISHLDLKLQNFIITDDFDVKIIDYGISKILPPDSSVIYGGDNLGTVIYMSPELLASKEKFFAKKSDIWAMGIILYILIYDFQPKFVKSSFLFVAETAEDYAAYILQNYSFYTPRCVNATDFLLKMMFHCLARSENDRPAANELIEKILRVNSFPFA